MKPLFEHISNNIFKLIKENNGGIHANAGFGNPYGEYEYIVQDLINFSEKYPTQNYPISNITSSDSFKSLPPADQNRPDSITRIQNADYSFPIILQVDDNDNNKVLGIGDGTHRIRAAIRDRKTSIPAKLIPLKDWSKFKK